MKLFDFIFKKFEQKATSVQAVETWIVSWRSISKKRYLHLDDGIYDTKIRFNTFVSEESAKAYADELEKARKLLGDVEMDVTVYKNQVPTNC